MGQAQADVTTPGGSSVSQAIGLLYGSTVSKDLISVAIDKSGEAESPWTAEAMASNANHQSKKFILLLFINRKLLRAGDVGIDPFNKIAWLNRQE